MNLKNKFILVCFLYKSEIIKNTNISEGQAIIAIVFVDKASANDKLEMYKDTLFLFI